MTHPSISQPLTSPAPPVGVAIHASSPEPDHADVTEDALDEQPASSQASAGGSRVRTLFATIANSSSSLVSAATSFLGTGQSKRPALTRDISGFEDASQLDFTGVLRTAGELTRADIECVQPLAL